MIRTLGLLAVCAAAMAAAKLPFTVEAMMKIHRIGEPQLSPDGKMVAFTVQDVDLPNNTKPQQIWVVPVSGGGPRQITRDGSRNERPRWMPDSKQIVYVSNRSGGSQIWTMDADGNNARQITTLSTEAGGVLVSRDGKQIVFTSSVYPSCAAASVAFDDACNKKRADEEKESKVKVRTYTSLLYRHWTEWQSPRRQHLLTQDIAGGKVRDLTPGNRDVPPFSLGGGDDYAISPDSSEVAYVMNSDPNLAISTNSDIFVVPVGGGEAKKISTSVGADNLPVYSPDGRYIAFRSQARAGYESDRWRLAVWERGTDKIGFLTESLDRPVDSIAWTPDSQRLFFVYEDRGRHGLQIVPVLGGAFKTIISGPSSVDDVQLSGDSKTLVYTEQSGSRPAEIFKATSAGGVGIPLSHLNDGLFAQYELNPLDEFWVDSPDGSRVHSFVARPPDFNPQRKYPVLFLIHGGPQGAWGESFSYRWNAQVFASAGYLVVMPNPRGSTGYGQKFTDEINADWGGRVYEDIMAVVDYVVKQPYADADRMAAAGGSYGGYMVDWLLGHTDRFKALISHAGVYDLRSMAGETEELWFPLWEFKGMPWDNPELYAKWSPSSYVDSFKTPTLVMHGEMDYRVPVGQAMQLFTALQMKKVPSKLVLFPDEGHWILKPQNSVVWYGQFLEWVGEWVRK
jgi:dipeptidyl aminopeptidase/acylaminoacyl peptidase